MSIVLRFRPASSVTTEQYDKSWEALEKAKLDWPPSGLDYCVCFFGSDGNILTAPPFAAASAVRQSPLIIATHWGHCG